MYAAIIVAGGTGSRMKIGTPKQFALLKNKPVIVYSIEKFFQFNSDTQIIISLHPDFFEEWNIIEKKYSLKKTHVVKGGNTRYQSVKNALAVLNEQTGIIAIHDAARPLVSMGTIQNAFSCAQKNNSAIPVIDIAESIRHVKKDGNSDSVNRTEYKIVQTPQCFKKDILLQSYETPYQESFTDDASVLEAAGHSVTLCEGNIENIKITYPKDIAIAELLLS